MKNNGFYKVLTLLIFITIILILFLKPPKIKNGNSIPYEDKILLTAFSLKSRIDYFYRLKKYYPDNLKGFKKFYDLEIEKYFLFESYKNDYIIKIKNPINDTIISLTKDSIIKEKYEK